MELEGVVQNGVIVVACPRVLPEGTTVRLHWNEPGEKCSSTESTAATADKSTLPERLLKLAGTVDDLPIDMASNHDHYIHGTPKS